MSPSSSIALIELGATPTLFLADVHLGLSERVDKRFGSFLAQVPSSVTIISLGDLVDFWLEGPGYDLFDMYPVLQEFKNRSSFFLKGNRDFMIGKRWEQITGGKVSGDSVIVETCGTRWMCVHGDMLLTADNRYRIWRAVCRSAVFSTLSSRISRPIALFLARMLKRGSEFEVGRKSSSALTLDLDRASTVSVESGCNGLVCGHTHQAARRIRGKAEIFTLGAWDQRGEVIFIDSRGLQFAAAEEIDFG